MTSKQWNNKIKRAMKENEIYRKTFDNTIKILSEILAERDAVMEKYDGVPVIMHTNSHGATNPVKNQHLVMWNELNKTALSYIKELGLTPAGLKKLTSLDNKRSSHMFDEFLEKITGVD